MMAPRIREKVTVGKKLLPATHQLPKLPIDKGISYPRYSVRLPCRDMEVGDSFFYPRVKWAHLSAYIAGYQKRLGWTFRYEYRREGDEWGCRVWRMPDDWVRPELPIDKDKPCPW